MTPKWVERGLNASWGWRHSGLSVLKPREEAGGASWVTEHSDQCSSWVKHGGPALLPLRGTRSSALLGASEGPGKTLVCLGPASGDAGALFLSPQTSNLHQMFHITQCEKSPILSDFLQVHTSMETRYSIFHSALWMSLWGMRVHRQQAPSGFDQLDRN